MRHVPVLAVLLLLPMCAASARASSLPDVGSGHRPGPDVLYAPPAAAPQLQNTAPWKAPPILVSGAQAYRDGEWLYQDFLFDDHGAAGVIDPTAPYGLVTNLFSPTAGTFTYPTDPVYANNAADLVELRVRPLADATAFRVTLNTLKDADRTAFTIALGSSPAPRAWPHGAGASSPAAYFLTVHGGTAELLDAATGQAVAPAPSATVDMERRQIEVRVPHAAWDPGTSTVRMTIGVGLWNPAAGRYLAPRLGPAGTETPGGGLPGGSALVNVGPRFDEPKPDVTKPIAPLTIADSAAGAAIQAAWWRERAQADALRTGDLGAFHADVDFGKLAAGTDDDSGVPQTGAIDRIMASHYSFGQGVDPTQVCFDLLTSSGSGARCHGRDVGQLQPYALYVPAKPQPRDGWGLTLLLHSLSANYNQYLSSRNQSQLGDRGAGSLVATPEGRGPDGFYAGVPEADTFEVWADVARHYELDPTLTDVSGYSMGGFGTYRLLARWPDLFARGFSVVGIPGSVDDQLASLRNTPLLAWNALADELVPITESEAAEQHLAATGLRFTEDLFLLADHLTLSTNDQFAPGAQFLGDHRVDRNPPHVTYVVDPTEDDADAGVVADHAYWLSGLSLRDPHTAEHTGTIDARSEAFGVGDPRVLGVKQSTGTLEGGSHGPMPFTQREQGWGAPPETPKRDVLDVRAENIATATVDAARARLSCAPQIHLESDGPLDLRIACAGAAGASGKARPRRCRRRVTLRLPRVVGRRIVRVAVRRHGRRLKVRHGHDLRRVRVKRPSHRRHRAFRVTLRLRTNGRGRHAQRIVVHRRVPRCGEARRP